MKPVEKKPKKKKSQFWNEDEEYSQQAHIQCKPKVKINIFPAEFSGSEENSNSIMKNMELFKFEKKSPSKDTQHEKSQSNNPSPTSPVNFSDISENSNSKLMEEKSEKNELGADGIPFWAQNDGIRDKKLKKKGDPGYDPKTIHIPLEELNKMTPAMKQYWIIKSENFDKIVLFKYGNFYETYYEDSIICHKILDLAWVGKKLNVGFPEKSLDKYSFILVEKGYKLCLVEQTETLNQMKSRSKFQERGKKDKIINREVIQIITRGTVYTPTAQLDSPRFLFAIGKWENIIGFAVFELLKCEIYVGGFLDDENSSVFKNFYERFRPVEVLYYHDYLPSKLRNIINEYLPLPEFSNLDDKKLWSKDSIKNELISNFSDENEWPVGLKSLLDSKEYSSDFFLKALSGLFNYLKEIKLFPRVLSSCKFSLFDLTSYFQTRMVLDNISLQSLEIIDESQNKKSQNPNSLFDFINRTVTKSGKRLLREWIKSPLLNPEKIEERLDAIAELASIEDLVDKIRIDLKRLPDLEKKFSKIFMMATQTGEKIISFENISETSLRDFKSILDDFLDARTILKDLDGFNFKSKLIKSLINARFDGEKEYDVEKIIFELSNQIIWEGVKKDIPTPRKGNDQRYDEAKETIESLELQFQKYLIEIQNRFDNDKRISYAHTRHRYELEFPQELVEGNKKPRDFEFSSKKQGFERFITQYIKLLVQRLELAEENLKICLNDFTISIFKQFTKYSEIWDRLINCISLLDCLASLCLVSFKNNGYQMCRPKFLSESENKKVIIIKESIHPLVLSAKGIFVPNDIEIIDGIILLTGPNMGGKSTILRQVCLLIVMAQIGCYVPAKNCTLTIVDRIFTRIGAFDDLANGKSTFYIELEDISKMLKYSTQNSFLAIDELGRGTSTFDGYATAFSVLKFIACKIKCRGIFSTHFFDLADELSEISNILPYHMLTKVNPDEDKIQFLYKLVQGKASYNFAFNVAALAGINKAILKVAQQKKENFDELVGFRKQNFTLIQIMNLLRLNIEDETSKIESVFEKLNEFCT